LQDFIWPRRFDAKESGHRVEALLMNGNLAQFGEDLRLHLLGLQVSLNNIRGLFSGGGDPDAPEFAARLDELRGMAQDCASRCTLLRTSLDSGLRDDAALAQEHLTRWVALRQTAQLHARADTIEQLAVTAVELMTLSAIEAERVAMTAILARRQAVAIQVRRGDSL